MQALQEKRPPVITVGSGAFENILLCDGVLQLGGKHIVQQEESLGGSGLNYTLRLLAAGKEVLPILPVGDDPLGQLIRESILVAAEKVPGPPSILRTQHQNPPFHDPCQPASDYRLFGKIHRR